MTAETNFLGTQIFTAVWHSSLFSLVKFSISPALICCTISQKFGRSAYFSFSLNFIEYPDPFLMYFALLRDFRMLYWHTSKTLYRSLSSMLSKVGLFVWNEYFDLCSSQRQLRIFLNNIWNLLEVLSFQVIQDDRHYFSFPLHWISLQIKKWLVLLYFFPASEIVIIGLTHKIVPWTRERILE